MGGTETQLTGPDFGAGIDDPRLDENGKLLGHANGEAVLLAKVGGEYVAIAASCTHYGGPLAEGAIENGHVRCPWHHACFSLKTGCRPPMRSPATTPPTCSSTPVATRRSTAPTPRRRTGARSTSSRPTATSTRRAATSSTAPASPRSSARARTTRAAAARALRAAVAAPAAAAAEAGPAAPGTTTQTPQCNGCKGSGTALDTATPTEQQGVKNATSSGAKPIRIGGQLLTPGAVGSLSSDSNQLPTPLIVLLAALGACALALAGLAGWNRVVARRAR